MHSVILKSKHDFDGGSQANIHNAVMWCDKNIGRGQYNIDNQFPSWNWKFTFQHKKDAVHFALLWA